MAGVEEAVILQLRVRGGDTTISGSLAPKVGPLGVSPKRLADQIADITSDWLGIKVMVKVTIQNHQFECELVPTAPALIIKALKEPPRDRKKVKNILHDGNLALADIVEIARQLRFKSRAKTFAGTVKEVLGTCVAIGCTVDGEHPRTIQQQITDGTVELGDEDE